MTECAESETYGAETEMHRSETKTLRILSKTRPRRDVSRPTSRDGLETGTSVPRPHLRLFNTELAEYWRSLQVCTRMLSTGANVATGHILKSICGKTD